MSRTSMLRVARVTMKSSAMIRAYTYSYTFEGVTQPEPRVE